MSQSSENSLITSKPAPSLWTCLLDAIRNHKHEAVFSLLDGKHPRLKPCSGTIRGKLIAAALLSGNLKVYKRVCEAINHPYFLDPSFFETLVRNNKYEVIKHLAQAYPDAVRKLANPNDLSEPLIHIAVQSSSVEVFGLLLLFTTKETVLRLSSNKISLLDEAIMHGPNCVVDLLIHQPYINDLIQVAGAEKDRSCTALHNAALRCEYRVFKKLFDTYASLGDVCDLPEDEDCSVLIFLMRPSSEDENQVETEVMQFIEDLGHDHPLITKADCFNHTPLHWAVYRGLGKVIDILYPIYVAKDLHLARTTKQGHTFFNYLIRYGHTHIIRSLLERKDFDLRLLSIFDNAGKLPILLAICEKQVEICELLYPISVSTGSIAEPYKHGLNALISAVDMDCLPIVRLLMSEPTVIDALMVGASDGHSPLHHAIHGSSVEICALIYERSTVEQICLRSKHWGLTALHWAIMYRDVDMIEPLLKDHIKARALLEVKDVDGRTAMDYARLRSSEIVSMLEAVIGM